MYIGLIAFLLLPANFVKVSDHTYKHVELVEQGHIVGEYYQERRGEYFQAVCYDATGNAESEFSSESQARAFLEGCKAH